MCLAYTVVFVGPVADIEDDAPDRVCCQTAPKQRDVYDVVLVKGIAAGPDRGFRHGLARFDAEVETGAQDTADDGDDEALGEVELGDAFAFFLVGQLPFLEHPGAAADINAQQTHQDADQHPTSPAGGKEFAERAV